MSSAGKIIPTNQGLGAALTALHLQVLGPDAPETKASAWLAEHAEKGALKDALLALGIVIEEGPGIAYRMYQALTQHFKEAA